MSKLVANLSGEQMDLLRASVEYTIRTSNFEAEARTFLFSYFSPFEPENVLKKCS